MVMQDQNLERQPSNIKKYSNEDLEKLLFDHLYHKFGKRFLDYRKKYYDSINYNLSGNEGNYPNTVILELVNRCNLECVMCHQEWRNDSKKYTMSDNDLDVIFDSFKKNKLNSLMLSISEPLLYKNIEKVFKRAEEAEIMDIFLFTNGTLLNEKNSRKILESSVTRLFISIDAFSKEIYDKVRIPVTKNIKSNRIEQLQNNIKNFMKLRDQYDRRFPLVRTSFVELGDNKHEVEEFKNKWLNIVDSVEVQKEVSINAYSETSKFNLDELFSYSKKKDKDYNCRQPWSSIGIYSDGTVTPCCNTFGRNLPIGNIRDDKIENIWKNHKIKKIREAFDKKTPCVGCTICLDNTAE